MFQFLIIKQEIDLIVYPSSMLIFTIISLSIYLTVFDVNSQRTFKNIDALSNGKLCGHTNIPSRNKVDRISMGKVARPGMFPSYLKLLVHTDSYDTFKCGGVLIHNNLALTANHCVEGATKIEVIPGIDSSGYPRGRTLTCIQVCRPKGNVTPYEFDVAVLRFKERVKYDNYIYPACIPTKGMSSYNSSGDFIAIGTGERYENDRFNKPLSYTTLREGCPGNLEQIFQGKPFTCYKSSPNPRSYICKGDSGSGIYSHQKYGSQTLQFVHGIASQTYFNQELSCGVTSQVHSVFADVFKSKDVLGSLISDCMQVRDDES